MASLLRFKFPFQISKKLKGFGVLRVVLGILGFVLVLVGFGGFGWAPPSSSFRENSAIFPGLFQPHKADSTEDELKPEVREFGLRIEKLGILVPVIANIDGTRESIYNRALEQGVAHYEGTALPGQGGNVFIFGHSGLTYDKGPYSTVFSHLEDLGWDDRITVYYQGEEFEYSVFWEKVIERSDISVLEPTQQEQLTIMTCWPVGDNKQRHVIKASLVE